MIKIVGKKIITGDLNLTRISFPIKAMVPKTALENSTLSCCMSPYFMARACQSKDPIERMKYVITNTVSAFYYMSMFLKPVIRARFSWTQWSEKPFKAAILTEQPSTANKFLTILRSATSWLWDLKTPIDTMATTTSQLTQDSTPWLSPTKAPKLMNLQMADELMLLSTNKSIQVFLWVVCVHRRLRE